MSIYISMILQIFAVDVWSCLIDLFSIIFWVGEDAILEQKFYNRYDDICFIA